LGRIFKARGWKVGYLKPVSVVAEKADASDKDAEFIKHTLALEEPIELLCPVSLSAKEFLASVNEKEPAWLKKAEEAYVRVTQGKDAVLIEGVGGFKAGSPQALAGSRTVETLGAKAILIASYESSLQASQIVDAAKGLAGHLLGVVINSVPQRRMESTKATPVKSIEQNGIKVLGTIPEDRTLFTVSVGELAEHLGGNIINAPERSDNLIEAIMVGAMSPDPAVSYLSLKQNKAVVTRGDRPDIQLAALQTSTSCLVLTNSVNYHPLPTILSLAKTTKVPIVMVKNDTIHTMEALEGIFDKAKFSHEKKVERLEQLVEQHLDLEAIYKAA
jgi:hypothetical protein